MGNGNEAEIPGHETGSHDSHQVVSGHVLPTIAKPDSLQELAKYEMWRESLGGVPPRDPSV